MNINTHEDKHRCPPAGSLHTNRTEDKTDLEIKELGNSVTSFICNYSRNLQQY
jgi:hypothetical protein